MMLIVEHCNLEHCKIEEHYMFEEDCMIEEHYMTEAQNIMF